MNKNSTRIKLLNKIIQKSKLEKKAQEVIDQTKPSLDGEDFAEKIFDQILNSIKIEELD